MNDSECQPLPASAELPAGEHTDLDAGTRVRELVDLHYDFVWRTLQYLGMGATSAEDGAQQVMCVLARRIRDVRPGAERPFLFSTCVRVAAAERRAVRRRPPTAEVTDLDILAAESPSADEMVDRRRARETLARVLEEIPEDLRLVFVLFEIEELGTPEIAEMLAIPVGTAASRLRRARESFQAIVRRMKAAGATRQREGGQ
jgi:RNA polymerase sigma-70 factor (ECF subfamily)